VVPSLRSVVARSIHPDDRASRIDALNLLLPKLIRAMPDEPHGWPARMLFRLEPNTETLTLTRRRQQIASQLHRDPDHFRTHIEPKVLQEVALAILADLRKYRPRVKRAMVAMEPTGDTPALRQDDITEEEELVSRIWQHVYGLRAELIAVGRLTGVANYEDVVEEHRQAANILYRDLRQLIDDYTTTYGERLIKRGNSEYAVEGPTRLAGWVL
jgi:hypothetical protein